ncbi:MAG: hypothetical protein JW833_03820 [Prolixibacteraceae bacterium]|nr:hypothetical protein [Prolixibacteraceae bacterium]
MASVYFKEKQYLRNTQFMSVVILFSIFVFLVYIIQLLQLISDIEPVFPEKQGIIIFRIFEILLVFVLYILDSGYLLKMDTTITDQSVIFRMYPFMKKFRIIEKENIRHFQMISSKELKGYNGWSLRRAFGRRKGYYTVSGNYGLLLVLTNDEKVILGTQKKQAIIRAMEDLLNKEKIIR